MIASPPAHPSSLGRLERVACGTPAPDFELLDTAGKLFSLSAAVATGPVLLVFFRGHWCPYCRRYLGKLQSHLSRFTELGARLIAISPEPPPTGAALAAELGLTFPLLSDSEGRVISRYGARNGFSGSTLPHASVFVVDAAGIVRFVSIDRNYKKRTTMRTIVVVLEACRAADGGVLPLTSIS